MNPQNTSFVHKFKYNVPIYYRPESRIYAIHMSYDPEKGLITDSHYPVMLIAFSEEVQGFEDSKVQVSNGFTRSQQLFNLFGHIA